MREVDLDAAVQAGIISGEQASALREGFARPAAPTVKADPGGPHRGSERLVIARSFNEIFVSLGILILAGAFGMAYILTEGMVAPVGPFAAWVLAELLLGRHRLVLPGNVLAGLFGTSLFACLAPWMPANEHVALLLAGIGTIPYLVRFKAPFAAFVSGGMILGFFMFAIGLRWHTPFTILAAGMGMFIAAMALDIMDPLRRKIHSQAAFWLHLLAAPLIVNAVMLFLDGRSRASGLLDFPLLPVLRNVMTPGWALSILVIVTLLSLVALLIDRRALLVSSLGYLGGALGYWATAVGGKEVGILVTLFILGAGVVFLGLGWRSIRAGLIGRLPKSGLMGYLPPA